MVQRNISALLLVAIFLINFLSLIYQVVWMRSIMLVFGTTALSISTILTVFLSGIALGGYLGGRFIGSIENKTRFCGLALISLGIYCLASIYIFGLLNYPFHFFTEITGSSALLNLVKFAFCFIVLIFPTTVIGSMFPIVSHLYSREFSRLGQDIASIYFMDTLGAAIGALLCGFFLVPVAGLKLTAIGSGLIFILIGALVLASRGSGSEVEAVPEEKVFGKKRREVEEPEASTALRYFILAALFLTGLSALVLEVTWSRYFHLILGSGIYAFSMVVAAFLLGLSVGSLAIRRYFVRIKNPKLLFSYLCFFIAGISFLVIQTGDIFEVLYFYLFHATGDFYLFQGLIFLVTFALLLVPTSLMGANFPLAVKIFSSSAGRRTRDAGMVFSINTAGGIAGAFLAGFILIPLIGVEGSAVLAAGIYVAIGSAFLFIAHPKRLHYAALSIVAIIFLASGAASYGGPSQHVSVYYNGVRFKSMEDYRRARDKIKIIYAKQGLYGEVSVHVDPYLNALVLLNNGKVDASTTKSDMQTQELLGHLPLFFKKNARTVLNIGLGSGITTGAVASHPGVELIDSIEIDPLVSDVAGSFFAPYNNNALSDPRVRVFNEDGRHYLENTHVNYDVIISEPPNIWVSGVSQLFTREFYEIAASRLTPGGVLCQWIPAYEMDPEDMDLILHTIKEKFDYVGYWTNNADSIILASNEMLLPDYDHISRLMRNPVTLKEIRRGLPNVDTARIFSILNNPARMLGPEDKLPENIKRFNTDNLPLLEFKSARNIYKRGHAVRTAKKKGS